jgi:hypothetical protein
MQIDAVIRDLNDSTHIGPATSQPDYTTIANPTMSFFNACSSLRASTSKLFSRAGPSNPTATTIRPASSYVSLGDLKPSKGSNKDVCGFALAHEKTGLTD